MSYEVREESGKHCVYKKGGAKMKCYDDKAEATRYMRALYANVHEGIAEFSMAIVKANIKDGVMRWRSVNSDIDEDFYGERMSRELFKDFIQHIENEDPIPEPFKSVIAEPDWDGGMPYLSVAHYRSGKGKINVPGEPNNIFLDGNALKSTGILYDTPLGHAVFKSLSKDLVEKREDKIRISIGFLDLEHSHGDKFTFTRKALTDKCPLCKEGVGDKIYTKGHLVHLALTRVPANPRTDIEVERSMTTKREDAESIIEDEEVLKGLDLKSQAEDVQSILVIKSEPEPVVVEEAKGEKKEMPHEDDEEMDDKKKKMHKKMEQEEKSVSENTVSTVVIPDNTNTVTIASTSNVVVPTPEPTPLEKSLAALTNQVVAIKSQGLTGDNALKEIQPVFDEIGSVLRAEFEPKPTPEQAANQNLEATLRSFKEELLQAISQTVAPMQSELNELRALSLAKQPVQPRKEEIPQPRSLQLNLQQKSAIESVTQKAKQYKSFAEIARESTGLQ